MWGILQRYAAIAFLGSLLSLGAFAGGCLHGSKIERQKELAKQDKIEKSFNLLINNLNDEYSKKDKLNSIKYESLQNEMDKVNDDLRKCKLSHSVVQLVHRSANVQVAKNSGTDVSAYAGESANHYPMTCEDLSNTLVAHDRLYFEAKTKLDFFQALPWPKE